MTQLNWSLNGGIYRAAIRKGFLTLYIVPVADAYLIRVNGVEVKRYPATLDDAKALAIRAANKLLKETTALLDQDSAEMPLLKRAS